MKDKSVRSKTAKHPQATVTPQRDPNPMEVSGTTIVREQNGFNYGEQLGQNSQYPPQKIPGFTLPGPQQQDQSQEIRPNQPQEIRQNQKNPDQVQILKKCQNFYSSRLGCNWIRQACVKCSRMRQGVNCQWFTNLDKKKKAAIIVTSLVLTFAIIFLPIYFTLISNDIIPSQQMNLNEVYYNDTISFVNSMLGTTKNNHTYTTFITDKKVEVYHQILESVLKMVITSNNDEQIHLNIPLLNIFQIFNNRRKQKKVLADWLEDYNKNPKETINQLIEIMKQELSKPGSYKFGKRIPDNLKIISISQKSEIDVEYNPFQLNFKAVLFNAQDQISANKNSTKKQKIDVQNNLKSQQGKDKTQNSKSVDVQNNDNSTVPKAQDKEIGTINDHYKKKGDSIIDTKNWTISDEVLKKRVMLEALFYIKRVVARNVEVLRKKREQLETFQKKIMDESEIQQEWQKVLVNDCRTLGSLRFRCSFEGAMKLVPGLKLQQIYSNAEFVISETLSLVFKETSDSQ